MKDKSYSKSPFEKIRERKLEKRFQKKRRALGRKLYRTAKRDMHSQSNTTGYSTDIMRIGQLPCGATIAVQLICDNCDCHSK